MFNIHYLLVDSIGSIACFNLYTCWFAGDFDSLHHATIPCQIYKYNNS